jgi:putative DNA primase/helicase
MSAKDGVREIICKKDGFYRRLNGKRVRIAERLRVIARARDAQRMGWSRLIEFTDADGDPKDPKRLLIPEKHLNDRGGQQLISALSDAGYDLPKEKEDRTVIVDYIRSSATKKRALIVRATGYVGKGAYLLGSQLIGVNSGLYVLDPTIPVDSERFQPHGTLADWQREIVDVVTGNRLCMLAIMASFVGPLIKPLNLESSGIQFYGDSSQGKSGLLACAASVIGRPSNGAMVTWSTTVNAIDDLALARSDSALIIDETASAGDPKTAADVILLAIYRIAGGAEKARKHNGVGQRPVPGRWRVFAISSSEKSLPELAKLGGQDLFDGCLVRFIDIAADAGQHLGVYDQLPTGTDLPFQLTDRLKRSAEKYCGTAQRQFLEQLLKDLNNPESNVIDFLSDRIDSFYERSGATGFDGIEDRIAKRFGAIYAAGSLARKYKVLPWSREEMKQACLFCYRGAIKRHAAAKAAEETDVKNHIRDCWKQLKTRLARIPGPKDPNAPGWLKTPRSGNQEIILTAATFEQDLCGNFNQSKVIGIPWTKKSSFATRTKNPRSSGQYLASKRHEGTAITCSSTGHYATGSTACLSSAKVIASLPRSEERNRMPQ